MQQIVSKVDGRLIATVLMFTDALSDGVYREDGSGTESPLQVALIGIPKQHTFRAHRHKIKATQFFECPTQECWVVLRSQIRVDVYDIDKTLLEQVFLNPGDSITFVDGGHGYTNTGLVRAIVLETKSGQYYGPEADKEYLDDSTT